ncbi:hypothetical protein HanIR_Chr11g0525171 [Helianthus annuus]|nr:hypothetical protein HanIR_Chr11g0525171 [Helianthus annuus]
MTVGSPPSIQHRGHNYITGPSRMGHCGLDICKCLLLCKSVLILIFFFYSYVAFELLHLLYLKCLCKSE